jgi:hypothetical protein
MRRQIAAVAVVALLLFAGCNGGSGPASTPDDPMTTAAPGGETPADADPIYETPLDVSSVADAHVEALNEGGTFTMVSNATQSSSEQNTTAETSTVVRGDLSSGAVFTRTESRQQNVEGYAFANGTAYQRFTMGDDVQYIQADERVGNASQYARSSVETFVGLFNFTHSGTQSSDGATVHVYEAAGVENLNTSAPAFRGVNESMVESADATLHIREDGVVTLASYDITVSAQGQEQTVTAVQKYTDIGETDVSPPEWIGEAQNATSQ